MRVQIAEFMFYPRTAGVKPEQGDRARLWDKDFTQLVSAISDQPGAPTGLRAVS